MELLQNIWWEEGKSLNISISGLYGPRKTHNDISSNDLYQITVQSGIIGGVAVIGRLDIVIIINKRGGWMGLKK